MFRQWFSIFWFFILVSSTRLLAQVGAPGSFEKYEFQPEAWTVPETENWEVNKHGDLTGSLQLASITNPAGNEFSFNLSYSSDIRYESVAGWLGLGWQSNIGTITRSVKGREMPDPNFGGTTDGDVRSMNPVDFPSNVHGDRWDKAYDIFTITLPDGESFEASLKVESRLKNVHEFEPHSKKGYKVFARYSSFSMGGYPVAQCNKYTGGDQAFTAQDYYQFLIIAPNGVRYLYEFPSPELSIGPYGSQSIFVSTWRISVIYSRYHGLDPWIRPATPDNNTILFYYSKLEVNKFYKSNSGGQSSLNTYISNFERLQSIYSFMYPDSVKSTTGQIKFTYMDDRDVDVQSFEKIHINSDGGSPYYEVEETVGRRRLTGLIRMGGSRNGYKSLDTISLEYQNYHQRSLLRRITYKSLENNSLVFTYETPDFQDFDYTLIKNYYNHTGEYNYYSSFLNNRSYLPDALPWDVNGYSKRRGTNSTEAYETDAMPQAAQLTGIHSPRGMNIEIRYEKKKISLQPIESGSNHVQEITQENRYKRFFPLMVRRKVDSAEEWTTFLSEELMIDYSNYFDVDGKVYNHFFKSMPVEITKKDQYSPRQHTIHYDIKETDCRIPGIPKELNFSDFRRMHRYDHINGEVLNNFQTELVQSLNPPAARPTDIDDQTYVLYMTKLVDGKQIEIRNTDLPSVQDIGVIVFVPPYENMQISVCMYGNNYYQVLEQEYVTTTSVDDPIRFETREDKRDYYSSTKNLNEALLPGSGFIRDFRTHYLYEKQTVYSESRSTTTDKSYWMYDPYGNVQISASLVGKNRNQYQFDVRFTRYFYEDSQVFTPQAEINAFITNRNLPIQEITGFLYLDSLTMLNQEDTYRWITELNRQIRQLTNQVNAPEDSYKSMMKNFKMTGNVVTTYEPDQSGIYHVKSIWEAKSFKWYRFDLSSATSLPDLTRWVNRYTIESRTSFGKPVSINFNRFREMFYYGSSTDPFDEVEINSQWNKLTGVRIVSDGLSGIDFRFSARYDDRGRLIASSLPNQLYYDYAYDQFNRLSKVFRNGKLIKSQFYRYSRDNSSNPYSVSSSATYLSTVDSIFQVDFSDCFGVIQSVVGNQLSTIIQEPVFNIYWENTGSILPVKLDSHDPLFINPLLKKFNPSVTNGGNLQTDRFNQDDPEKRYDQSYYLTKKDAAFDRTSRYAFTNTTKTSFGSATYSWQSGEQHYKKSKKVIDLVGDWDYHLKVNVRVDEDNRVRYSVREKNGLTLMEGVAVTGFSSNQNGLKIVDLISGTTKIPSTPQGEGVVSPGELPTPPGSGNGPTGPPVFSPPQDCIQMSDMIANLEATSVALDDQVLATIRKETGSCFTPFASQGRIGVPDPGYTEITEGTNQVFLSPLSFLVISIKDLPAGKSINLYVRKSQNADSTWVWVDKFTGPITADTILYTKAKAGEEYKINYYQDLGYNGSPVQSPLKLHRLDLLTMISLSNTSYQYNDLNQLVAVIHPDRSKTEYDYDFFGRVTKKETPYHQAKRKDLNKPESDLQSNPDFEYRYDQYGQLRFSIDPNQSQSGKMTVNLYDGIGRVIETGEMNSAGRFTEANATSFMYPFTAVVNNGTAVLDPTDRGNMTTPADYAWQQQIFYDLDDSSQGRMSQTMDRIEKPDGTMGTYTKSIQYRKPGWVAKVTTVYTDGLVQTEEFLKHDNLGKPAEMVVKLNNILYRKTWIEYTPFGQPYRVFHSRNTTKPAQPHFTYEWDAAGRQVSKVINPINSRVATAYTPENWLLSINFAQNGSSSSILDIRYNYFDPSMLSGQTVKPSYAGQITQMKTKYGDETTEQFDAFFYDDLNRLISSDSDVKSANGSVTQNPFSTSYRYDIMGNILQTRRNWMDPGVNQVREKDNFQYQYAGNRLLNLVDLSPVTTSDSRNVVTVTNTILGSETMYNTTYPGVYDSFEQYAAGSSLPASQYQSSLPSSKVVLTIDGSNGRVLKVAPASASVAGKVTLDTLQVVGARTYTLKLRYRNDYAFNGEINEVKTKTSFSVKWLRANLTEISEVLALDRVSSTNWINATKTLTAPAEAAFAIPVLSSFSATGASDGVFSWMDNVSMEETNRSYAYDSNGNTITDNIRGVTGMMYNRLNLPVQLTTQSQVIKYGYSWSGARLWKKTPSSTTFYLRASDGSILGEYAGAVSSLKYLMLPGAGGTTEGQWEMNGTTFMAEYFYITDHLGNNRVSVKNNGGTPLVTGKTDYYPYGSVSREWTTSTENLRKYKYQQKERDLETGYDYFEARTYDSQIGRFLQVDPLAEKFTYLTPFSGMGNDPIKYVDKSGMVFGDFKEKMKIKLQVAAQQGVQYANKMMGSLTKDGKAESACNFGVRQAFFEYTGSKDLFPESHGGKVTDLNNNGGAGDANDVSLYLESEEGKLDWEEITDVEQVQQLANNGEFVVGAYTSSTGSGHVVVAVPGEATASNWNGIMQMVPMVMDTGRNMRSEKQGANKSFGPLKRKTVKWFKLKAKYVDGKKVYELPENETEKHEIDSINR